MSQQYQTGDYVRIHDHDGTEITVKITDSGIPNRQGDFTFKAGARMFKNSEILGLGEVPVVMKFDKPFELGSRVKIIHGELIGTIGLIEGKAFPYRVDFSNGNSGWYQPVDLCHAPTPAPDTEVHTEVEAENERARILSTAESLINGDRADAYGHPKENFGRIAALWNAQLGKKLSEPLTAEDVAYALVQLKMSRLANTPGHEDSLVDVAGYIALAGELK
ncbi:DUF6378 domain-containing protein [Glutamicibacter sp.]|uniref:DUF6378 domain-containing protein n=1 Tax=Glutamicibacter sp. TaxID=1931995 RepID=UPI002B46FAC1|nr:DUF6378 domain-containing protein [Glutamicibacter sp.]HJX77299.1 DUF6378 domain-containing protein [Glutamicibacter sp.]